MKISVLNRVEVCPAQQDDIKKLFQRLNQEISDQQLLVSHMIVDGQVIYSDFVDYVIDNAEAISDVQIIAKNRAEYVYDVLVSAADYMERLLPGAKNLAAKFYRVPDGETWTEFSQLIEGVQWIIETFVLIEKEWLGEILDYEAWNKYTQTVLQLNEQVKNLTQALESEDSTLIGDIISYEMLPIFEQMHKGLAEIVKDKFNK